MPRKLSIEYPGAIYHVMSRADGKGDIFLDDVDRQDFLKTLAEACAKTGFQVHAHCLMRNHFHLVVETPNANLVAGMRWLLSTYTIRLNHRHKLFGHVFSGRYKALVVDGSGNGYLRTVCDYVHLNPVRAKLLGPEQRLLEYPWSSFGLYLAGWAHRPQWLRVDRLLGEHGIEEDTAAGRGGSLSSRWKRVGPRERTKRSGHRFAGDGALGRPSLRQNFWSRSKASWASTIPGRCGGRVPKPEASGSSGKN